MPKGIIGGVMILVGLGLILKFGKSSTTLFNSGVGGVENVLNTLTLSNYAPQTF